MPEVVLPIYGEVARRAGGAGWEELHLPARRGGRRRRRRVGPRI